MISIYNKLKLIPKSKSKMLKLWLMYFILKKAKITVSNAEADAIKKIANARQEEAE